MEDMSGDTSNVGALMTIATPIIVMMLSLAAFWTRITDRIKDAHAVGVAAGVKAEEAIQDAAEAKNETANLREAFSEMMHDLDDRIERRTRDYGETATAMRQTVTELAFFVRDKFVLKEDFSEDMTEIKRVLAKIIDKVDEMSARLPPRRS